MIDAFAESIGIPMDTVHCKAIFGKGLSTALGLLLLFLFVSLSVFVGTLEF